MKKLVVGIILALGTGKVCLVNATPVSMELSFKISKKVFTSQKKEKMNVVLKNVSKRSVKVWGFKQTQTGGPDLTPYLEFHFVQLPREKEIVFQSHRKLPPILDLYGRAYDLKPGQSWLQEFHHWFPDADTSSPPPGHYEMKLEFDDVQAVDSLIKKADSVGKISSAATLIEIKK